MSADRRPGWKVPVCLGFAGSLGMAVRLFVPTPVAMANNGDADRLMCQVGADADAPPIGNVHNTYFRTFYPSLNGRRACQLYPSTQVLPLRVTSWIHRDVLRLPGAIDMREVMVEYCVLAGLVIAAVAWLLRSTHRTVRLAISVMLFLVMADATFADYAGSAFTEAAALYGLLIFAVAGAVVIGSTRGRLPAFAIATAAAVYAVGSKEQMLTLALPLGLFLATRKIEVWKLCGPWRSRTLPAVSVVLLALVCVRTVSEEAPWLETLNAGQEITLTIMPTQRDPAQAATDLGLPASFGKYVGTDWWSPNPIEKDSQFARYHSVFTRKHLTKYLAQHPTAAMKIISAGAASYLQFRNSYIGTYTATSGAPPGAQECRICIVSDISHALAWTGITGIISYLAIQAAIGIWLIRNSRPASYRRAFALIALVLLGCTIVQYLTSVFGDGLELTRHLSVALFAASLSPIFLVAAASLDRLKDRTRNRMAVTAVGTGCVPIRPVAFTQGRAGNPRDPTNHMAWQNPETLQDPPCGVE